MRVFAANKGFSLVCSASLAPGPWGLASVQAPSAAAAGVPRMADRNENGIQVRPASRPENSRLPLRDYPQFVADCSKFLTKPR
jgi:hypothetical protein